MFQDSNLSSITKSLYFSFIFSPDNHRNGHRQLSVNNIAEHVGAGTGTANYVGVPGTGVSGHHGYAHGYRHGYNSHSNNYY